MSENRKSWSLLKTDPALVLALGSTVVFYCIVLQPAMHGTLLARYTSEHAVEYVIVTLFFWGMFDIILKLLALPREYLATRHEWIPPKVGREPASKSVELLAHVRNNSAWLLASRTGRRLINALTFVAEKGSAADYREHLQHLADLDDQESHTNYTVLRFVIAVTPILGFLGTVVHFGAAIGGFSFEDMEAKLPEIVSGMGTAFNTTSVALATAMTMMFAMFLCERVELSVVASIDRLIDHDLLHRFEVKDANIVPFLAVIQTANREALDGIARTSQEQVKIWTKGLDVLFEHFAERQRLELLREQASFDALRQRYESFESQREDQMRQFFALIDKRHDENWAQIQLALDRASMFREDVSQLLQAMNAIARGEGRLVELQTSLADNLRLLNDSSQIDSALHGLTAAIHLITSRSRTIGMSDSAAA